jgi:hypothetical protein
MPGRKGLMSNKTSSDIPKTPLEKKRWIMARKVVAKQTGAKDDKQMPWALVNHIMKEEKKAKKTITKKDVKKTNVTKSGIRYKKQSERKN